MKRGIWSLLPVLLCLAALLCLSAMAGTALGEGVTLTLEGGTLTISGVGTVPSDVLTRLTEEERETLGRLLGIVTDNIAKMLERGDL